MKKILLLTAEYPNPDSNYDTPIIHYFTKEWVKLGYEVKVFHYRSIFPIVLYWVANLFNKTVKKFVGTDFVPLKRRTKTISYLKDDVQVYSVPIFKWIPHGKYSKSTLEKHLHEINEINRADDFIPDIIIGHFYNPQLELVAKLKQQFPMAITSIVLHEGPEIIKKAYPDRYAALFQYIDIWGFRFRNLKERFEKLFGTNYPTFICHSGVPEEYIYSARSQKHFSPPIKKFCYTGMLIPLKRIEDIILSLHTSYPNKDFEFKIVGEGMERDRLFELVNSLGLSQQIQFLGRLPRNEVQKVINEADCFVMVSESEAFGLVYLEAMSKGCITIGTFGQGIDGVIMNGVNGYLCESKKPDQLSAIFNKINQMSPDDLLGISQNAIDTAINMTDAKVAQTYLNNLFKTQTGI